MQFLSLPFLPVHECKLICYSLIRTSDEKSLGHLIYGTVCSWIDWFMSLSQICFHAHLIKLRDEKVCNNSHKKISRWNTLVSDLRRCRNLFSIKWLQLIYGNGVHNYYFCDDEPAACWPYPTNSGTFSGTYFLSSIISTKEYLTFLSATSQNLTTDMRCCCVGGVRGDPSF